jgi:Acetamidase/Formamidase family
MGALFSVGDGHGAQGDGEVCITAVETALTGRFRLTVRNDIELAAPRAETPTHYITMGFDEDLDDAVRQSLRDMIRWIGEMRGLSKSVGGRFPRHPDRQRGEGRPLHASKIHFRSSINKEPSNPETTLPSEGIELRTPTMTTVRPGR